MTETGKDEDLQEAINMLGQALERFSTPEASVADVMEGIDTLIHVRIAQTVEMLADRFEVKMVDIREAMKGSAND